MGATYTRHTTLWEMKITEEMIDRATRVICEGLPITISGPITFAGMVAKGNCWAPDCLCWERGRQLTRAALEAALEQKP